MSTGSLPLRIFSYWGGLGEELLVACATRSSGWGRFGVELVGGADGRLADQVVVGVRQCIRNFAAVVEMTVEKGVGTRAG